MSCCRCRCCGAFIQCCCRNGKDGQNGIDGISPHIDEATGNWWIGNVDTGIKAQGLPGIDGESPYIGMNGNWWVGSIDTGVQAQGNPGKDGKSVTILGSYPTIEDLILNHPTGNLGDGYLVNGDLYVWNGTSWENVGNIQGPTGQNGVNGITPHIGVNNNWFIGSIDTGITAIGKDGKDGLTPTVYHTNLSTTGSSYDVIVGNVVYHLQASAGTIALSLRSTGSSILADVKRSSQYDATGIEGSSLNGVTLTTTNQSLDSIIYDNSNEMHRTWIRQRDPITNLWSLYEVDLFPSANGARTDIWVYKIYENASY